MPIPHLQDTGYLPPGIHAATLSDVAARFGSGSEPRQRQMDLLRLVVEAARWYPTIKRVLVWGSFVTSKPEPNDLDYSLIVSVQHHRAAVRAEHRRFIVPIDARRYYGVDRSFLVIKDYPLEEFLDRMLFVCEGRELQQRGIVEISIRGEYMEGQ